MITTEKETDIQKAICDYLALKKYFFWRNNNTPISMIRDGQRVFRALPKYARKGVSDILLLNNHVFYAIEVKSKTGSQSSEQMEFERDWIMNGGIYAVVKSIDDVKAIGL